MPAQPPGGGQRGAGLNLSQKSPSLREAAGGWRDPPGTSWPEEAGAEPPFGAFNTMDSEGREAAEAARGGVQGGGQGEADGEADGEAKGEVASRPRTSPAWEWAPHGD